MPSLTREQFEKWNSKAKNGFQFDVQEYVCWGNKSLVRHENLSDGKIAEFKIWFEDEYEVKNYDKGGTWNVLTGKHIPTLVMNILHPSSTEGVYRVQSFGKGVKLYDAVPRTNYSMLCKLSQDVDVDSYLKNMRTA